VIGLLVAAAGVVAEERIRVAILPIVVYSLGNDEYLRLGLGNMLASRIGSDPRLVVVQLDRAELGTTDPEAAREAARSAGADYVLYGSFTRFGEGASLDLQCASVSEEGMTGREIFIQTGALREIIPSLGPLAEKVVRYVAGTAPAPAPTSPTASLDGADPSALEALQERVEALEEAVFPAELAMPSQAAEQEDVGAELLESQVGAEPLESEVGAEPLESEVGAQPLESEVRAEPFENEVDAELLESEVGEEPFENEVGAEPEEPGPEEALASEEVPEGERTVPDQKAETMR
jgi:TolB-like protein